MFNLLPLIEYLRENKTITKLAFRNMNIGEFPLHNEYLGDLMLYNTTLEVLDLSNNQIAKLEKFFPNLVRNGDSNILHINLSNNKVEIEDFAAFLKLIDKPSSFNNLHFMLRLLNLSNNPMQAFDMKIEKMLTEFYNNQHRKLFIIASEYQERNVIIDEAKQTKDIIKHVDGLVTDKIN